MKKSGGVEKMAEYRSFTLNVKKENWRLLMKIVYLAALNDIFISRSHLINIAIGEFYKDKGNDELIETVKKIKGIT